LFVLSLPVSPMQHAAAKMIAALLAFALPWSVLTLGTVALIALVPDAPDGGIPSFVAMMAFFLANFCVLLALVLALPSERWAIAGILATNFAVPIYLGRFMALPDVARHKLADTAVWSPPVLTSIVATLLIAVASLALALYVHSRRKDPL
jgi:hypothetical protein